MRFVLDMIQTLAVTLAICGAMHVVGRLLPEVPTDRSPLHVQLAAYPWLHP